MCQFNFVGRKYFGKHKVFNLGVTDCRHGGLGQNCIEWHVSEKRIPCQQAFQDILVILALHRHSIVRL